MEPFKAVKKFLVDLLAVEKKFRLGRLNQKWCNLSIIMWIIAVLSGWSFKYLPMAGQNFFRGFEVNFNTGVPWALTIIAVLGYPVCAIGLIISKNRGWIDKEDF